MKIGMRRNKTKISGSERQLRAARLRAARSNPRWTELEQDDLFLRPGRVLVSYSTDDAYLPHPGQIWERGSANAVADLAALYWYEDSNTGQPRFVEKMPATWSEQIARQARHGRVAA